MEEIGQKWYRYYSTVALLNSTVALVITLPVFIEDWNVAKVISGGSAGTWLTVGYLLFFIVGIGVLYLCGLVYCLVPKAVGKEEIYSEKLAATQLVLMEIAILGACLGLYIAGFIGGRMLLAKIEAPKIHEILVQFVLPILAFVAAGLIGASLGIINYALTLRKATK